MIYFLVWHFGQHVRDTKAAKAEWAEKQSKIQDALLQCQGVLDAMPTLALPAAEEEDDEDKSQTDDVMGLLEKEETAHASTDEKDEDELVNMGQQVAERIDAIVQRHVACAAAQARKAEKQESKIHELQIVVQGLRTGMEALEAQYQEAEAKHKEAVKLHEKEKNKWQKW